MELEKGNLTNYKTILKAGRISSLAVAILYSGYFLYAFLFYYNLQKMIPGDEMISPYLLKGSKNLLLIVSLFVLIFFYQLYTFYQYLNYQEIKKYIGKCATTMLICSVAFIIIAIVEELGIEYLKVNNYVNITITICVFAILMIISFVMGCILIKKKDNITKEFSSLGYAMCISSVLFPLWFIVVPIYLYNIFAKEERNMAISMSPNNKEYK